jgi:hypothetical protein
MFGIKRRLKNCLREVLRESMPPVPKEQVPPTQEILARAYGHSLTLETKRPVAADGSPLPWYTYPAIEYCNQIDARGLDIFEYGSGNSSLFWAHKGANVWCVEHDKEWYENMCTKSAQLRGIALGQSAEKYALAISDVGRDFDVIIIDGAWRNECAAQAIRHTKQGALVILDNSDWYSDVAQFLRAQGYFQVDFNGFGPVNNYCWTTSIFLPFESALISRIHQPHPIGGIEVFRGEKW